MFDTNSKVQFLDGQQFSRVKNGLDEADVIACINSLMEQNVHLSQRLHDVDTLMKSSESTIVEAGKQAKAMGMKIEDEAQAEAAALITKGKESAMASAAAIIAEVRTNASAEMTRIHEEAVHLRTTAMRRVEREVRERFDSICEDLFPDANIQMSAVDAIEEQGMTGESETSETDSIDQTDAMPLEAAQELAPTLGDAPCEAIDQWDTVIELDTPDTLTASEVNRAGEHASESPESSLTEPETSLDTSPRGEDDPDTNDALYEGAVEIRIPPPIALDRVLKMHRELKDNPLIDVRCFSASADDGVKVDLNLLTSVPIVQLLSCMPGVQEVEVVRDRSTKQRRKENTPTASVFRVTVA